MMAKKRFIGQLAIKVEEEEEDPFKWLSLGRRKT